MASGKNRKCPFNECFLPDNNKKYLVQIVYLVISTGLLAIDVTRFTFLSILMYTFPVVIDLVSTDADLKAYSIIKWLFVCVNALYVAFCVLGMGGYFIDSGDVITIVETAIIFPAKIIKKNYLFYGLIPDVVVPVMMFFACPTKKSLKVQRQAVEIGRR